MRTCSAWNWTTLDYTYYTCPGEASPGGWQPPELDRPAPHGAPVHIEDLLPSMPAGCKEVGRGAFAKGQIVKPVTSGVSGFSAVADLVTDWKTLLIGVGLGAGILWLIGSRRG